MGCNKREKKIKKIEGGEVGRRVERGDDDVKNH